MGIKDPHHMGNKIKLRHIAQSNNNQKAANDVNADVKREPEHASRPVNHAPAAQTTAVPAGGYPFAPPFMQPENHRRMRARTMHQAQPIATPSSEVQTVEATITIRVVHVATRYPLQLVFTTPPSPRVVG